MDETEKVKFKRAGEISQSTQFMNYFFISELGVSIFKLSTSCSESRFKIHIQTNSLTRLI